MKRREIVQFFSKFYLRYRPRSVIPAERQSFPVRKAVVRGRSGTEIKSEYIRTAGYSPASVDNHGSNRRARIGMQRAREVKLSSPSPPPPPPLAPYLPALTYYPSSILSKQRESIGAHAHRVNGPATRSSTLGTRSRKLNFLINDTRARARARRHRRRVVGILVSRRSSNARAFTISSVPSFQ